MKFRTTIFILLFPFFSLFGQYAESGFSLSISANYTTTSRLFLNPNSSDRFIRETFESLDNIIHYSMDLRYRLSSITAIGLNIELIKKTYFGKNVTASSPSGVIRVEVEDGYMIIPVELNLIYLLPFSTNSLKFYMSGGAGFYFGKHIRNFGNAEIESKEDGIPFGIQVEVGMEYMIFENLSTRFNMRFRDPEITFISNYKSRNVIYNNTNILLPIKSFTTKVNIDGVTFGLGFVFHI